MPSAKDTTAKLQIVSGLVESWQPGLGLQDWIINIEIRDEPNEDEGCEAAITEDLRYHYATLEIFPEFWVNEQTQEKWIVHELCHLLLCRLHPFMAPAGDDVLEEVVQTIAMRFYGS